MKAKPIRISGEVKKPIEKIPPPEHISFQYIPQQTIDEKMKLFFAQLISDYELKNVEIQFEEKESAVNTIFGGDLNFYLSNQAVEKMFHHCAEMAYKNLEALGFLIGEQRQWKRKKFSVVHDVVTSDLESTSISVRFHRDAFDKLFDQLDEIPYDYILVGWYHSHPGFSSFMSHVDVDTQQRTFNKPFHAAVVIDPLSLEMKCFRLLKEQCVEIPYAIFVEAMESNQKIPVETEEFLCPSCGELFNIRKNTEQEEIHCPICGNIF